MPVIHTPSAPTHELEGARFTTLAAPSRGATDTSVWRVELHPGAPATPHALTREEVFVILAGRARATLGDDASEVGAGDVIVVPADTPFSLAAVGDRPLEALVCFPVGGQARVGDHTFTPPWAE